jgi:HAD superfamily hydrolase (TIGR01509 family)
MLLPRFPLIAFDLDGTLADTESLAVPGAIAVLREHFGVQVTLEHWLAHYHGMAGKPLLARLNADFNASIDWDTFVARRMERLEADFASGVHPAPGVYAVLKTLHAAGQPMCICSNSMRVRIEYSLAHLSGQTAAGINLTKLFAGQIFPAVNEPDVQAKPAPDVYLKAALHHHAAPSACVAVEDSVTGAKAALAAGFITIGYVGLAQHKELEATKLEAAGVQHIMHDWNEFLPLLETL